MEGVCVCVWGGGCQGTTGLSLFEVVMRGSTVVSHRGSLSTVASHWGSLSTGWPLIWVVFQQGGLSSG